MKRKHILSLGNAQSSLSDLPQQYSVAKQRWMCVVSVEDGKGIVDEYDVTPDRKLFLNDFLDIIKEEVANLEGGDEAAWGVKVYRLSSKKV